MTLLLTMCTNWFRSHDPKSKNYGCWSLMHTHFLGLKPWGGDLCTRFWTGSLTPKNGWLFVPAVYDLRWKFIQIQTQQVRNFRIFSSIHTCPPTVKCKTNNVPFFASLWKFWARQYKASQKFFNVYGNISL